MFKYIKAFFRGAYKILFYYPRIRKYAKNKDKYPLEERYAFARKLITIAFKSLNVKIEGKGLELLNDDENYFFVSNHQGFMDPLAMVYLSEKPLIFVCKKEALKYPFAGKVIYFIDGIFVDREDIRDSVRMIKKCKEELLNGKNVVIYPEGTRTRDVNHMPGEYKAGSLKPAFETKKRIVSITIDGSYKVLSKKYKKDLNVYIVVNEVINNSVYETTNTTELSEKIRGKMLLNLEKIRKQEG